MNTAARIKQPRATKTGLIKLADTFDKVKACSNLGDILDGLFIAVGGLLWMAELLAAAELKELQETLKE